MNKICILEKESLWCEHGKISYSKDLARLYELIKDKDFEIVIGEHNDFYMKWEEVKSKCSRNKEINNE